MVVLTKEVMYAEVLYPRTLDAFLPMVTSELVSLLPFLA